MVPSLVTGAEDLCSYSEYIPPDTCSQQENDRTTHQGQLTWGEDIIDGGMLLVIDHEKENRSF